MVTLGTGCEAYFQNLSNTQFGNLEEGRIHKRMRDVVSNESDNYRILQQCSLSWYFARYFHRILAIFRNFFQNFWKEMWVILRNIYIKKSLRAVVLDTLHLNES